MAALALVWTLESGSGDAQTAPEPATCGKNGLRGPKLL